MHRDLKPENLLVTKNRKLKICDFGGSVEHDGSDSFQQRKTFLGTYEYMAPEMVGNVPHDNKIDIWALGILLYELVHNREPFKIDKKSGRPDTSNIVNGEITFKANLSP
jgi:serine/threonine protein kinase